jgi:SAM-dependent methyltransferase
MADDAFEDPRLARLYDPFDPDRSDLDVYVELVAELGAHVVVDLGCGTGTLACLLAGRGHDVIGVDPAAASLDVARTKEHAERVRWVRGDATTLADSLADLSTAPDARVDLVVMTANVAQVFVTDESWLSTLRSVRRVLRPGGWLVFETRDPAREAWRDWTREHTHDVTSIAGESIETWCDLLDVSGELVSFRWTYVFDDGTRLTSDSTLRFRDRLGLEGALAEAGFEVAEVRDAPDRPGREWVFLARAVAAT